MSNSDNRPVEDIDEHYAAYLEHRRQTADDPEHPDDVRAAEQSWIQQWESQMREARIAEVDQDIFPARSGIAFLQRERIPVEAYVPGFIYTGALNALVG